MTTSNRGPGSRPLSEDEIMEMIFSKRGAQMSVMVTSIVLTYIGFTFLFGW